MFEELSTPAFVVDRAIVRRNCERMRARLNPPTRLRPHVKTHKTLEGARLQLGAETGPITVSTLAEAEFFADGGFRDITWAVPIAPSKIGRAATLATRIDRLNLLVDHVDSVDALDAFASSSSTGFDVFLKVDCGTHRAGVDPESAASIALVERIVASPHLRFRGLLTHAGHSYDVDSVEAIREIAAEEAACLTRFAGKLQVAGIGVETRSIGSTPTCSVVERLPGVEEARPGNYVFFDAVQTGLGSCTLEDCAASVIVSVIGHYPERAAIVTDGGALALSKDGGARHPGREPEYGVVCDLAGTPIPGLHLRGLSQEHGQIAVDAGVEIERFAIGARLRVIPNHSCLTAALFDRYTVVEGAEVVGEWKPARGW